MTGHVVLQSSCQREQRKRQRTILENDTENEQEAKQSIREKIERNAWLVEGVGAPEIDRDSGLNIRV